MSTFASALALAAEALQFALDNCPAVPAYADTHIELSTQIERLTEMVDLEEAIERAAQEQA